MKTNQYSVFRSIILGFAFSLTCSSFCFSQTANQQLDQLFNQYLEYGKFNGSVLVAEQGKVLYKKGFGMANMEWDIPNTPDTKHRLASVTKQFTALLILQLAAEGKLDLHAPITKYLPDYPKETGDQITTHHLLIHTSGIPSYTSFPDYFAELSRDHFEPKEFVKKFQDKDLDFAPGGQFSYNNSGYFLLGVLIEKLTGKTYEQAVQDNIFVPLGMKDSGYDDHHRIIRNRATGYEKSRNNFVNSSYIDMSTPYAAGALYSTVEDLFLWDQALYTNQLLPKKYMDLFFKPYIPCFGDFYYAYGWMIGKEAIGNTTDSVSTISHGGGINGFNTLITRAVSNKSVIVLLNNTGGASLNQIARSIRGILNGKSYDPPKKSLAYDVLDVIQAQGIEEGLEHFETNKASDTMDLDEYEMNSVGYQLMEDGHIEGAAQVFKLNITAFPKSSNVYDSYAEALMNLGDNEGAIKNYRISVEMNPNNQNGINMLEKLGDDTSDLVKDVIVADEILATYVGEYQLMPGFILAISKEGNQLKAKATGQPMFDIFPKSNEVFYLKVVDAQITFNRGENGEVESLTLLQGGQELTGNKLPEESGNSSEASPPKSSNELPNEGLNQYIGTYTSNQLPIDLTISVEGNQLMGQGTGQPSFPLTAEGDHVFSNKGIGLKITFQPNNKKLTFEQGGVAFEMASEN